MDRGSCTDQDKQGCTEAFGDNLDWACAHCPKKPGGDNDNEISEYTAKLLHMRMLRMAGYPLKADHLTHEEWIDLGRVEQWVQM
jgi:hypothetical protein